jgi:hypothetical protein
MPIALDMSEISGCANIAPIANGRSASTSPFGISMIVKSITAISIRIIYMPDAIRKLHENPYLRKLSPSASAPATSTIR